METYPACIQQLLVYIVFHAVPVFKNFFRVGILYIHIIDKGESADRTRMHSEAAHHPFFGSKGELPLTQTVFESVYIEVFMTFHADQIMSVALMVSEKQIFAVSRIVNVFPIFKALFYAGKGRMLEKLKFNPVNFKKVQYFFSQRFSLIHTCNLVIFV